MKKFLYSLISIWLCLGLTLLSQNPEWITYNSINSGLPDNWVHSLAIDRNGIKWIGTSNGLAKFDGTNWGVYDTTNSGLPDNYVHALAIDGSGNKWIGTWYGLVKFDGTNWTVYDTTNSGLPHNWVNCLVIDVSGNKWIGAGDTFFGARGLAKFDGTNWTVYNTANSQLPSNDVYSLAIDGSGNMWIGTGGGGLAKFDDTNSGGAGWTVYNTSNSGLPSNWVSSVAIDGSGNKWIGTGGGGLAKYDGANWTVYNGSNSGLPSTDVSSIAIEGSGDKWIGTVNGLAKYDGTNWTVYNTSNSGLPSNPLSILAIEESGNKWISSGGLTVFNEGGVVPVELTSFIATANGKEVILNWSTATELNNNGFEVQRKAAENGFAAIGFVKGQGTTTNQKEYSYTDKNLADGKYFYRLKQIDYDGSYEYSNVIEVDVTSLDKFALEQNYPNPFNPSTTIKYQLAGKERVQLKIYDVLGAEITILVNEEKDPGSYKVELNADNLPSGVYFYKLQAGEFTATRKMLLVK